ncbi:TPA: glycosyltransferase family 1 protein, partial [Escherichia coli]|nr:glycosyltransferase family 1 protein [Escherichia coli]
MSKSMLYIYTHNGYNDAFLKKDVGMVPSVMLNGGKVDSLIYCKEKKGKAVFNNLEI